MNKKNGVKALTIIHKAMLLGQLIFGTICFYLVYTKAVSINPLDELDKVLQVIAIILSVAGYLIGNVLFKKKLIIAKNLNTGATEKFALYQAASILQWALIEGPSLFSIICFFLTNNYAFLALAAALVLLFTMMVPSKTKIAFQLAISEDELGAL